MGQKNIVLKRVLYVLCTLIGAAALLSAPAVAVADTADIATDTEVYLSEDHVCHGVWVTVSEPTCTEKGLRRQVCDECGAGFGDYEDIAKCAHTLRYKTEREPTCTASGSASEVCVICSKLFDQTIVPKTGHNYESKYAVKPSVTNKGVIVHTCTICGNSYETTESSYAWIVVVSVIFGVLFAVGMFNYVRALKNC